MSMLSRSGCDHPAEVRTIEWRAGSVVMIDQRALPLREVYVECTTWEEVADAIRSMVIRGAPAIGVAAAMAMALAGRAARHLERDGFERALQDATEGLFRTRPTAVNLGWALSEMRRVWDVRGGDQERIVDDLERRALEIYRDDLSSCRSIGAYGAELVLEEKPVILTHCNAGALATAGYGTALGVIRAVHARRPEVHVFVGETRPFLQGARLTAWELLHEGISAELITDSMAGHILSTGVVTQVIVGADRIAANGDTANKIGTYPLSVLAREHDVPFYVAAPLSTVDTSIPDGGHIPIEERDIDEVTHAGGTRVAPVGMRVRNPAFDVTPGRNITAIITERGVVRPPFGAGLARVMSSAADSGGDVCGP